LYTVFYYIKIFPLVGMKYF